MLCLPRRVCCQASRLRAFEIEFSWQQSLQDTASFLDADSYQVVPIAGVANIWLREAEEEGALGEYAANCSRDSSILQEGA